jgi:hypothetical protein
VAYFDVFDHPLDADELVGWLGVGAEAAIARAVGARRLARAGRFVFLPGRSALPARREARARRAERLWPTAHRAAAFLARFPWVRAVLVTGGLSKNSVDAEADVDFLLLVQPRRVWLAKTALQVLRRGLPPAAREALCTNYLLDTEHLEIPAEERDIYAAVELVTARPLYGPTGCRALLAANPWVRRWFPAAAIDAPSCARPIRASGPGRPALDPLDEAARRAWDRYWGAKYRHLAPDELGRRFRRDPHVSTNHLDDWRAPVLRAWRERLEAQGIPE